MDCFQRTILLLDTCVIFQIPQLPYLWGWSLQQDQATKVCCIITGLSRLGSWIVSGPFWKNLLFLLLITNRTSLIYCPVGHRRVFFITGPYHHRSIFTSGFWLVLQVLPLFRVLPECDSSVAISRGKMAIVEYPSSRALVVEMPQMVAPETKPRFLLWLFPHDLEVSWSAMEPWWALTKENLARQWQWLVQLGFQILVP